MFRVEHAERKHAAEVSECLSELDFAGRRFFDEPALLALIERQLLFVAIETSLGDERVAGAMVLVYDDHSYKIQAIACRRGSSRKGAGSALIRMAVEKCRAEGVPKLWCWSMERYKVSPFYEKQGFDERHLLRRQFFGEDCWLFGKSIDLSDGGK